MDAAGTYYIPTALDFEDALSLHTYQTRLACDTLFNRSPQGIDADERLHYLFTPAAIEAVNAKFDKERDQFRDQDIHQKVEIEEIKVLKTKGTDVLTSAKGQLIRIGIFNRKSFIVTFELEAQFVFKLNTRMRSNGRFPTICTKAVYKLSEIARS